MKISDDQFLTNSIELPDQDLVILVGGNNSGKSTILRAITKLQPNQSYRVDVNRTLIKGDGAFNKSYESQHLSNASSFFSSTVDDNTDRPFQVLQDYFLLEDVERIPILDWYNKYFPNRLYEERENVKNSASPMQLKVNGFSLTKQGSGMRATFEIFIKLFDPKIKVLCIDEPEIGLEPTLQKYLFQALKDKVSPEKKIIIATHSHHFIDQDVPTNNFIVLRDDQNKISTQQISGVDELPDVIFSLLGNTLASVLLPEKILIVEGDSDIIFIKKILNMMGKKGYGIQSARGLGGVKYSLRAVDHFLRFHATNVPAYAGKVFVLIDNLKDKTLVTEWKSILGGTTNIKQLSKNGVEFFYPERILQLIFNTTSETRDVIVTGYIGSRHEEKYNDVKISKIALSKKVVSLMTDADLIESNDLFDWLKLLS